MDFLTEWGLFGLFISSFLSATVIPFSSEFVLSFMILNGFDIYLTILIATIGNWLGGLSSYLIGRLGKWTIIEKYFGVDKNKVFNFKLKVDRWGSVLAFFSWLPIIGDVIAVSLGFFRTNFILVSIWMLLGKILRYIIWGSMTYWSLSILN
ncbi:MAG: hypothetical protein CMD12_01530 [Flavobacteriales bacterium]|nr:hypothetical protein [Flavobacteriaceae bacterium]MAV80651.1 hypothetical protein [Flavobacteriales bacterium]|tara:strand:- start:362 stop:814 length:453 start_codon:yes stop_codon:yes gene_type:complete